MSTRWVCRLCISIKGLRGVDINSWPDESDKPAINRHLKEAHHIDVVRDVDWSTVSCDCEDCKKTRELRALLDVLAPASSRFGVAAETFDDGEPGFHNPEEK